MSIVPPDGIMAQWEADYKIMQQNMIIGESLSWYELLQRLKDIENAFNQIEEL